MTKAHIDKFQKKKKKKKNGDKLKIRPSARS
uniref:Uncharacterized protein n=1 Tax=Candidozyma auris TaxID=498019 RepID=A0A0L0P5X0_CANAR